MELEYRLDKVEQVKSNVKGEEEIRYKVVMKLKKSAYEKDTENLKEGTGDPWGTISIVTTSKSNIDEFKGANMGDAFKITVTKV